MVERCRHASARQATRYVPPEGMEIASGAPAPEDRIEQQQHEAILRDAILALLTRCRQVYLLSRMEGLSYKQIANRCGISVKTRSEEHTSELQSLMRISYAVFCLKKKTHPNSIHYHTPLTTPTHRPILITPTPASTP